MSARVMIGLIIATLILAAPAQIGTLVVAVGLYLWLKAILGLHEQ